LGILRLRIFNQIIRLSSLISR